MSVNDVDDTLLSYFKQMLEEESADCVTDTNDNQEVQSGTLNTSLKEESAKLDNVTEPQIAESAGAEASHENDMSTTSEDVQETELNLSGADSSLNETIDSEPSDEVLDENVVEEQEVLPKEQPNDTLTLAENESLDIAEASESSSFEASAVESEHDSTDLRDTVDSVQKDLDTADDDIDYAADDYVPPKTAETAANEPVLAQVREPKVVEPLPFAEHKSLETLLEAVPKQQLMTEVKVAEEVKTETEVETVVTDKVEEHEKVEVKKDEVDKKAPYDWANIEMPDEFQVLFFLVKGIRFAVPLVNLGGIVQCDKVTPLFGKPDWFQGIADIRGKKMCVVDTLKWVKSDAPKSDKYEYMIVLDDTIWSVGCDTLEGNRILNKDSITWRQTAGNRPWLAGIVKKEMCALLHVSALIKMFENGVNLKDLDKQMRA